MFRTNQMKKIPGLLIGRRIASAGIVCVLTAGLLAGCGKGTEELEKEAELENLGENEEDLLIDRLNANQSDKDEYYETQKTYIGDFAKKQAFDATTLTPYYENVTLRGCEDLEDAIGNYQTVLFGEWSTWSGATVAEGDTLFTFRLSDEADEIELAKAELSLQRSRENYETYVTDTAVSMQKQYAEILEIEDATDRQVRLYQYSQTQLQNEKTRTAMQTALEEEEEAYARMLDDTVYEVKSPISGTVSIKMRELEEGDEFGVDDIMVTVNDTSRVYLVIEDTEHILRMGQEVLISGGQNSDVNQENGVVTAAPSAQTPMMSQTLSDAAYVADLSGKVAVDLVETMNNRWWSDETTYSVVANVIEEQDVLLVPADCVILESGSTYVNVLTDGKIHKRYFTSGGFNGEAYWAVEGLEEGLSLVVSRE